MKDYKLALTTNYGMFHSLDLNRPIKDSKVKDLERSMLNHQSPIPILVNELFEVIDGQHRLEACKNTGLPVYYVIEHGADIMTALTLNARQYNWKPYDYLKAYIGKGYPEYVKLQAILDMFPNITLGVVTQVATRLTVKAGGGFGNMHEDFKNGKFKIHGYDKTKETLDNLTEVMSYATIMHNRSFTSAYTIALGNEKFSHDDFITKLSKDPRKLFFSKTDKTEYIWRIQSIFNKGLSKPISLI